MDAGSRPSTVAACMARMLEPPPETNIASFLVAPPASRLLEGDMAALPTVAPTLALQLRF